jgi:hypothetical protein
MSSFLCRCGAVTPEAAEASGASGVLYSVDELDRAEARIADIVVGFLSAAVGPNRSAWLEAHFGRQYPG